MVGNILLLPTSLKMWSTQKFIATIFYFSICISIGFPGRERPRASFSASVQHSQLKSNIGLWQVTFFSVQPKHKAAYYELSVQVATKLPNFKSTASRNVRLVARLAHHCMVTVSCHAVVCHSLVMRESCGRWASKSRRSRLECADRVVHYSTSEYGVWWLQNLSPVQPQPTHFPEIAQPLVPSFHPLGVCSAQFSAVWEIAKHNVKLSRLLSCTILTALPHEPLSKMGSRFFVRWLLYLTHASPNFFITSTYSWAPQTT